MKSDLAQLCPPCIQVACTNFMYIEIYWRSKRREWSWSWSKGKKSIGRSFECCQRIFFCDIQNLSKMWVARKLYNFIHWSGDGGENDLKSISNIGIHRHVPNGVVHISPHQYMPNASLVFTPVCSLSSSLICCHRFKPQPPSPPTI